MFRLVLVDVAEGDLLEVLLVGIDGRPEEGVREQRRFHRRAVAHDFHVDGRRDRGRADVVDLGVDADHVAAAREGIGLHHLHAALLLRLEGQLHAVLAGRQRAGVARRRRVQVVVVREVAARHAGARQVGVILGVVEQRDEQVGLLAVAFLLQRQLRQRAAARVDLAVIDVGRELHQLRLGDRRGGIGCRGRGGRQGRRRAAGRRGAAARIGRGGAGGLRDVREEHRLASMGTLPVVVQHDR